MNFRWIQILSAWFAITAGTLCWAAEEQKAPEAKTPSPEVTKSDAKKPLDGENQPQSKPEKESAADKDQQKQPAASITHHTVTIADQEIAYTATADQLSIKTDQGEEKARIFFIAYRRESQEPSVQRPITFCFNGGPGSSSVWLHLGMLGPQRVQLRDDAQPQPPPFQLVPNHYSLLDITDLVFIDPVSTGYSRPAKDEDKNQFNGYQEDLNSVGQFIHDYITQNGRWQSPKFLVGESYGGLRAAGLAGLLQNRYGMYLNGLVLVSAVLDFQTLAFSETNDLPFIVFLPSYTATAWYHGKLDHDLQQLPLKKVVRKAESFAAGPYARALLQGDSLSSQKHDEIARQLATLTGLSPEYVLRANLRISMRRFAKELLRDRQETVGRFDSRYVGSDRDSVGEAYSYDPSAAVFMGPFTAAMNDYLYRTLDYKDERVYEILTGNVYPWNYNQFKNRYVNATETLRRAMTTNPFLKVFAACGYYDLATPQFAMTYTQDHLALAPKLASNFQMGFYQGGHMMYVYTPALKKLRKNLLGFYQEATYTSNQAEATPTEKN